MPTIKSTGTTVADFYGDEAPEFDVTREDSGDVVLKITTSGGDEIRVNIGRFYDSAEGLMANLRETANDVQRSIIDGWEDTPDYESDGWVCEIDNGYGVYLEGNQRPPRGTYPTRDIAVYELAKAMADSGFFPNAWYQNERGNTENIGEAVRKHHDAGGDKMLPLEGVEFEEGDRITDGTGSSDWPWVVEKDYGHLGVVAHMSGDPTIREHITDRSQVVKYDEGDDE